MAWQDVAASKDVAEDFPISVQVGEQEIGVYRVDGKLFAIEDVCPHAYALLSQGFVENDTIECPLHEALFHIPSGKCLREPGGRDLKTFPAKEEAGRVLIDV